MTQNYVLVKTRRRVVTDQIEAHFYINLSIMLQKSRNDGNENQMKNISQLF